MRLRSAISLVSDVMMKQLEHLLLFLLGHLLSNETVGETCDKDN